MGIVLGITRSVLGYLAAVFVASLIVWGWQMSVFTQPWPAQFGLVVQAAILLPLAVMFSAIPAFVVRMGAVIFHLFNPVTAAAGGALTGVAVYLLLGSEQMIGRPLAIEVTDLMVFAAAGLIAGLVWFRIENVGTTKE